MTTLNFQRSNAGHFLKVFLAGNFFFALMLIRLTSNPFNAYADLDFDPNKYDTKGKSAEKCREDLKKIHSEFIRLRDDLKKLLKKEGAFYDEIIKEREKGTEYVRKHKQKSNYISHRASEFYNRLSKILQQYGLPLEVTSKDLANEWKAQNMQMDSLQSLRTKTCELKSKMASSSDAHSHQTEIDQLKREVDKQEGEIKRLYDNTVDLIKLNGEISKEETELTKDKNQMEKYYEGIVRLGRLLDWNFEHKYRQLWPQIHTTYEKAKRMELGFDHMVALFKQSKDGNISFISDEYFVSTKWAYEEEKLPVILIKIRTEESKKLNKDTEINNIYSVYFQIKQKQLLGNKIAPHVALPAEVPINHPIFYRHSKARENWNKFKKVRKRSGELVEQYGSNINAAKKLLDKAKQCLKEIENKDAKEPVKVCPGHAYCDKVGIGTNRALDLNKDRICDTCGGRITGVSNIIDWPDTSRWHCPEHE